MTRPSNIKGKTYPIVDGDQDPDNLQCWKWQHSYKGKMPTEGFRSRSVSVPCLKAPEVRPTLARSRKY
jgi:hypothetical protein